VDDAFIERWEENSRPVRVLTAPVQVEPIFSPGNRWPAQAYGIMVEVAPVQPIPDHPRFALYFYFPPALGQAELLTVGDELFCFYGRFPFPGDPPNPPDPFGLRDRRRYAGLTIHRINGVVPPLVRESATEELQPRLALEPLEYEQWWEQRKKGKMNVTKWIGESGFPPVAPASAFVPEPGTERPHYNSVGLTGTLASDATASEVQLSGVKLPHSPISLRYLGERLSVGYGPPFGLSHLRCGDRVSLSADFIGFAHVHLQDTDWRLRATCSGVFWLSRPAP
jgi:hypothetical protein